MVNINSTLSTIALNANELIQSKERLSDNKKKMKIKLFAIQETHFRFKVTNAPETKDRKTIL